MANEPSDIGVDKISSELEEPQNSSSTDIDAHRLALEEHEIRAEVERKREAQAQGFIGKLLGNRDNAPVYIACIIFLVLTLLLVYLAIDYEESRSGIVELVKFAFSVILGFFAGIKRSGQ